MDTFHHIADGKSIHGDFDNAKNQFNAHMLVCVLAEKAAKRWLKVHESSQKAY